VAKGDSLRGQVAHHPEKSQTPAGVASEIDNQAAASVQFTASKKGEYAVLLMNWTECPADIVVEIPDWLNRALL
jgi:hypothetical protein